MATDDIRSELLPQLALGANITTNTTTNGSAIDTADYDRGLVFTPFAANYTDGTYDFTIEEADDAGFTVGVATVPAERIIGTLAGAQLTAAAAGGANLPSLGVVGNKRYIRINAVSTGVSTGSDVFILIHKKAELTPATGLSA